MSNHARRIANVITLPVRTANEVTANATDDMFEKLRRWFADDVDDWGRDEGIVHRVWTASQLRWETSVGGADFVPKRSGALIVVNARRFALAPVFAALAIGAAIDRPVRFVGRPDIIPLGPMMQRLGALLPLAPEIEGALRNGELVVLGSAHQATNRVSGEVDARLIGAAVAAKVKVLPAATTSVPLRRNARVEIGAPIALNRRRRGPLEEHEIALAVQFRIDSLLDELGGTLTGTPLDWLPLGGIGGL